jgi:hypothetical protein
LLPSFSDTPLTALIDCGADKDFIAPELAYSRSHLLKSLLSPLYVSLFDGTLSSSGPITHYTTTDICFPDGTCQTQDFLVFDIDPPSQIVFGLSWLMKYNPQIDWAACTLTLPSSTPMILMENPPTTSPQTPAPPSLQTPTSTLLPGVGDPTASSEVINDELTTLREYAPWAIHDPLVRTNSLDGRAAPAPCYSQFIFALSYRHHVQGM